MNSFTGRQARPQASINSLKWLWVVYQLLVLSLFTSLSFAADDLSLLQPQQNPPIDTCQANYSANDGKLHVPCVTLSSSEEGAAKAYQVDLALIPDTQPAKFAILQATEIDPNGLQSDNCHATYTVADGELFIPCVHADLGNGMESYSVML